MTPLDAPPDHVLPLAASPPHIRQLALSRTAIFFAPLSRRRGHRRRPQMHGAPSRRRHLRRPPPPSRPTLVPPTRPPAPPHRPICFRRRGGGGGQSMPGLPRVHPSSCRIPTERVQGRSYERDRRRERMCRLAITPRRRTRRPRSRRRSRNVMEVGPALSFRVSSREE